MTGELHRRERGHEFYPPVDMAASIPQLYGTEGVELADKMLHLHYFVNDCDWWVAEYDPAERLAFGYACLHGDSISAEWGYVSLVELEGIYQQGGIISSGDPDGSWRLLPHLIVERDLHWVPRPAKEANLPGFG